MKKIYALIILGVSILSSCSEDSEGETGETVNQGVITYSIEYPDVPKEGLYYLLPKEMHMTYKGDMYKTVVSHKGARFRTELVSDNENHTLTAIYEFGRDKMYSKMTKKEVDEFLSELPDVEYIPKDVVDSLFGVQCEHSLVLFNNISKEVHLAFTKDLGLTNPNWCNPYNEIDGVLLQYGVELYGVRMDYNITSLNRDTTISDAAFEIPDGYQEVPYVKIKSELIKLFDQVKVK